LAKAEIDVFIYGLIDPRTGAIRYIGKSKNPEKRLQQHLRDRKRRQHYPVSRWLHSLAGDGRVPVLTILWRGAESSWMGVERAEIAKHRAAGNLLNVADGGDEPHCSTEQRRRNGAKAAATRDKRMWPLLRALGDSLKRGMVSEAGKQRMLSRPDIFGSLFGLIRA
jgi:hypothetical protein